MGGNGKDWRLQPLAGVLQSAIMPLLDRADDGCRRLVEGHDEEALHDLRVSMRRIRVLLGAYRASLPFISEKLLRRLRKLMGRTNNARDAEVQLAWVSMRRSRLQARERLGVEWLTHFWQRQLDDCHEDLRNRAPRRWARLHVGVEECLDRIASSQSGRQAYAGVTVGALSQYCADFDEARTAVAAGNDAEGIHRLRIAVKRLRYLLEPCARYWPATAAVMDDLTTLQEQLGALNDRRVMADALRRAVRDAVGDYAGLLLENVLAETPGLPEQRLSMDDPMPGFFALARMVRLEQDEMYGQVCLWAREGDRLAERIRDITTVLQPGI